MSPYLRRITEYLSVPVERKEHLTIESDPNCYVGTYRSGINTVNRIYRLALDEKPVPKHWQKLKELVLNSSWRNFALQIFESQEHLNVPVSMPEKWRKSFMEKRFILQFHVWRIL